MSEDTVVRAFRDRLYELRVEHDLTQAQLAKKSKLSATYIHQLEKGVKIPSLLTLSQLAHGLGVEVSDLVASSKRLPRPRDPRKDEVAQTAKVFQHEDVATLRWLRRVISTALERPLK